MEVEALHNKEIGDLEPLLDLNGPPPLSPIANDPIQNEIVKPIIMNQMKISQLIISRD